jgi:hypothetical protein
MKKTDFIGVWKLVEYGNGKIRTSQTHLVVKDDILWEVWPNSVYHEGKPGPEVEYDFEEGIPAKLSLRNGFKYLVKKEGPTLFLKLGPVYGNFPENFEDSGNLGEYVLENEENSKIIEILPEKVKIEEYKLDGFGTLKYNANLRWWEGQTTFQERKIRLKISANEKQKYEPLEMVKTRLEKLEALFFGQIAAHKLLPLHNESWNENEEDLTLEVFKKKIELDSITLDLEGHSTVWLNDGNLFFGHSIQILLDAENNVINVGIVG